MVFQKTVLPPHYVVISQDTSREVRFYSSCNFLLFASGVQQDSFFFFNLFPRCSLKFTTWWLCYLFFFKLHSFLLMIVLPVRWVLFIKGRQEAWARAGSWGRAHGTGRGCWWHSLCPSRLLSDCWDPVNPSSVPSFTEASHTFNLGVRIPHAMARVIFLKHRPDCMPTCSDPPWVTMVTEKTTKQQWPSPPPQSILSESLLCYRLFANCFSPVVQPYS